MDLFELGFTVETAPVEKRMGAIATLLKTAEAQFRQTQQVANSGFIGTAKQTDALIRKLREYDQAIAQNQRQLSANSAARRAENAQLLANAKATAKAQRELRAIPENRRNDNAATAATVRSIREKLTLLQQERATIISNAAANRTAALERIAQLKQERASLLSTAASASRVEKERTLLIAKNAKEMVAAARALERVEKERIATIERQKAALASLEAKAVEAALVQVEAQRLLRAGYASNAAEARQMAAVLVQAREAGADPGRLVQLQNQLVFTRDATVATAELGAATQKLNAERLASQAVLPNASAALERERLIVDALALGYVRTRAEAEAYVNAMLKLQLGGGTNQQIAALQVLHGELSAARVAANGFITANELLDAQQKEAAASALALSVVVRNAGVANAQTIATQTAAQELLQLGINGTMAEVMRLAAAYLELKVASATPTELAEWIAQKKIIQSNTAAMEQQIAVTNALANAQRQAALAAAGLGASTNRAGAQAQVATHKFHNFERGVTRLRTGLFSIISIIGILGFDKLVRGMFEVSKQSTQIARGLDLVTHSSAETVTVTQQLMTEADTLGVSYVRLAENFTKFAVASKGSLTLGESMEVFTGMSLALRALGKDQVDTQRVFKALEQMVGKGVVSMEELRGQLGESLPSATRLMARGLNLTTAELIKQVSQGLVPAAAAVKALGAEMRKEFGAAGLAAAGTMAAVIDRIGNSFYRLFQTALEGGANDKLLDSLNALNVSLSNPKTVASLTSLINGLVNLTTFVLGNIDAIVELVKWTVILGVTWSVMKGIYAFIKGVTLLTAAYRTLAAATLLASMPMLPFIAIGTAVAAVAALIGFGFYKLINRAKSIEGATAAGARGLDGLTEAGKRQIAINEGIDSSLAMVESRLKSIADLKSSVTATLEGYTSRQLGRRALEDKGMSTEQISEASPKDLENVGTAQKELRKLEETLELKTKLAQGTSVVKASDELREQVAAQLGPLQASIDAKRIELGIHVDTLASGVALLHMEKERAKSVKQSATSAARASSEAEAYLKSVTIAMNQSQLAVELLGDGTAKTAEEAEKYAKMVGGGEKVRAEGIDNVVRAKLKEISLQEDSKRIAEDILKAQSAVDSTKVEQKAVLQQQYVTEGLIESTDAAANLDLISQRVLDKFNAWPFAVQKNIKLLEELAQKETEVEKAERARLAASELIQKSKQMTLATTSAQLSMELALSGAVDPDSDLRAVTEHLTMLREANQLKGASALSEAEMLRLAVAYGDQLRVNNAIEAEALHIQQMKGKLSDERQAQGVARSPGFDPRTMDVRVVQQAAKQKVTASGGAMGMEEATAAAIKEAEVLYNVELATRRATEAAQTAKSAWAGLREEWASSVPVLTQVAQVFVDAADQFGNQFGDAIANAVMGVTSLKEAMKSLAQSILRDMIASLVKLAVTMAFSKLFGGPEVGADATASGKAQEQAIKGVTVASIASAIAVGGTSAAMGLLVGMAWKEAAIYASIASFGAAAALGGAAFVAAVALANGAAAVGGGAGEAGGTLGGGGGAFVSGGSGLQGGGTAMKGRPHLVGEGGREIFIPQVNGRILSRDATTQLLSSQGNESDPMASLVARFAALSIPGGRASATEALGNVVPVERLQKMREKAEQRLTALGGASPSAQRSAQLLSFTNSVRDGRQFGGSATAGVPIRVGEAGREMFIPNGNQEVGGSSAALTSAAREDNLSRSLDALTVSAKPTEITANMPISVSVVNNLGVGSDAQVSESRGPDGERMIQVVLNAVAEDISRNGRISKAMGSKFKMTNRLGGRSG